MQKVQAERHDGSLPPGALEREVHLTEKGPYSRKSVRSPARWLRLLCGSGLLGITLSACTPARDTDPGNDTGGAGTSSTGTGGGGAGGGTTSSTTSEGGSGGTTTSATSEGGSGGTSTSTTSTTSEGGSGGTTTTTTTSTTSEGGSGGTSTSTTSEGGSGGTSTSTTSEGGSGGSGGSGCFDETCDGVDNDCDGLIDEGDNPCGGVCPLPPLGAACDGPDTDLCADDATICDGLNTVVCGPGPDTVELCNALDDDCDGTVDEGSNACGGVCPLALLPNAPCDGPDLDLCQDDKATCDGINATVCPSGESNAEICNGLDDDCNGAVDDACTAQPLFAQSDCDLDGDDMPPLTCLPPPLGPADTVACVCAAPPCPDPLCDTSHTTPADAYAAVATVNYGKRGILLFAGTYPGFTVSTIGGSGLFVGAHCDGGQREPVTLSSLLTLHTRATVEGLRLAAGYSTSGSWNDYTWLRELVLHGPLTLSGAYMARIEGVEIYPAAGGSIDVGALIDESQYVTVTRSATCSTGIGWKLFGWSGHAKLDRVLARDSYRGVSMIKGDFSGSGSVRLERCLITGCATGVEIPGQGGIQSIENCQFLANGKGIDVDGHYAFSYNVPDIGKIWNNLFAGNDDGIEATVSGDLALSTTLHIGDVAFNTFVNNTSQAIRLVGTSDANGTCKFVASMDAFHHNILAGNGTALQQQCGSVPTAHENLFFNTTSCDCQLPSPQNPAACPSPLTTCPGAATSLFTDPLLTTDHRLSQPPDQATTSPAVDASSVQATQECHNSLCLSQTTTSTALTADTGAADLGYHHLP